MKELSEYIKVAALTFIKVNAKAQVSFLRALLALMMLGAMNVNAEEISLQEIPYWQHEDGLWSFDAPKNTQATPEWRVGVSSDMPYGDQGVNHWADLSTFDKLVITYTEGKPRVLLNRDQDEGQWAEDENESHLIDNTRGGWSSKYFSDKDGVLTVNIKQILNEKGYVHLHAIKGADWANVTVNSMMLERDNAGWNEQLVNGNCEGSDVSCFMCREENGEEKSVRIVNGKGYQGSRCIQIKSMDNPEESWYTQFFIYTPNYVWKPGERYRFSFKARADKPAHLNSQGHAAPGSYLSWMTFGEYDITTGWKEYNYEGEIPDDVEGIQTIALDLNVLPEANTYYFDDISWVTQGNYTEKTFTVNKLKYRTTSSSTVEVLSHEEISNTVLTIPSQVNDGGTTYTVTSIAQQALSGCGLKNITIPKTIRSIGNQAFIYNDITAFNIPASVVSIGFQVFNANKKLTTITVDADNLNFCAENGVLFSKSKNILYRYPEGKTGDSYVIPNTVEILAISAFDDCENLRSVTIPQSLKECQWGPFLGSTNLASIICQANSPNEFGDDLFDESTYSNATLFVPTGSVSRYKSTNPWKKFKTIKEVPSQITVTAKSYEITYGDALPTFGYDVSDNSVTGTPKITCSATKVSNAGTYDINIQQGTMSGPVPLVFVKGKLTIKKAPLTISVGNYTKKQGDPLPTFKLSYSGFKNNETESVLTKKPTITCSATTTSAPGEYAITLSGATATNYSFTYKNGTLTVTKADAIVVTAKNYTITYGDAIPTLEYTTTGGTLSGKPTISCSAGSAGSRPNAGVYDITVAKGTVSNYNVSYVKGTLTVKKAPLTVSVGNYTKSEGEDMPNFVISYSGFKKSDTKNSLTKQPIATCEANKWSPAGSYPITLSGGQSSNYDFTYKNGTLTVSRYLTLTIMSQGHGAVNYGSANVVSYQSFDVKEGTSINLTFIPDNGYTLSQLTVNGEDVIKEVKNNTYSLGQLTKDVIVIASFVETTGTFLENGIYFSILSAADKTVIVRKSTSYHGHINVPESITRFDENWKVVGVADNAFNNCTRLITVTLPQSMKSDNMGLSLFTGCTKLAALVWNANFMLTTSVMGMVTNPNLLFYTKNSAYSPKGVENVIVNGIADKITLYDTTTEGDNFYCPTAFKAKDISYSHNYKMESAYGGVGGWETLALPFTVQKITHERVGDIVPFAAYDGSRAPFWLYTYSSSGFKRARTIEANVPYIICMPNNNEYDAEYRLSGKVTFSAKNAVVASSDGTAQNEKPSRGNKTFVAAYKAKTRAESTDVYAMNVINDLYSKTGGYNAGSIFISNLRTVAPFEAVMTSSSAASRVIGIDFNETTGIESLPTVYRNIYNVYNLNGQLLIKADNVEEQDRLMNQLPPGVYIVNGKKMIINK